MIAGEKLATTIAVTGLYMAAADSSPWMLIIGILAGMYAWNCARKDFGQEAEKLLRKAPENRRDADTSRQ